MTVAESFTQAFDALLKARKWSQTDVAVRTGLSSSMISRLASPDPEKNRGASFPTLELLRRAFDVRAAELFIPRVVDVHGRPVDSKEDAKAHTVDTSASHGVDSGVPLSHIGGAPMTHRDPKLLEAFYEYWDAASDDERLDVFAYIRRLRQPGSPSVSGKVSGA